jgi:hypothetical protein
MQKALHKKRNGEQRRLGERQACKLPIADDVGWQVN